MYISMQLCIGGDLAVWLSQQPAPYTEQRAARITYDMLQAVCCCHEHQLIHRDIKPQNILFTTKGTDGLLKLVDFGLAVRADPDGPPLEEICGTLDYMAPEMLAGDYDEKVDVWAIGVLLSAILWEFPTLHGSDSLGPHDDRLTQKSSLPSGGRTEWRCRVRVPV